MIWCECLCVLGTKGCTTKIREQSILLLDVFVFLCTCVCMCVYVLVWWMCLCVWVGVGACVYVNIRLFAEFQRVILWPMLCLIFHELYPFGPWSGQWINLLNNLVCKGTFETNDRVVFVFLLVQVSVCFGCVGVFVFVSVSCCECVSVDLCVSVDVLEHARSIVLCYVSEGEHFWWIYFKLLSSLCYTQRNRWIRFCWRNITL